MIPARDVLLPGRSVFNDGFSAMILSGGSDVQESVSSDLWSRRDTIYF